MDGFDDLLKSSANALDDNPFQDPFASTRPRSPDPWATFSAPAQDDIHGFASPTAPTTYQSSPDVPVAPSPVDAELDPFDSFHQPDALDETAFPAHTPLTPGFRESVDADEHPPQHNASETTSLSSTKPVSSVSPPSPTAPLRTPPASAAPALEPIHAPVSPHEPAAPPRSPSSPPPPPPPSSSKVERVISPLERTTGGIERSFASLAMGGESLGGWQDTSSSFINDPSISASTSHDSETAVDGPPAPEPPAVPSTLSPHKLAKNASGIEPLFTIGVDDPQKVGDPIRPYIMYTVHTSTSSPLFTKSTFSVLRRYSDFLWLYETLTNNNPGVFVPPVPEKSSFGRFESQFVQQRRIGLEKCVQKMANHSVLQKDPDLRLFLESDTFSLDIKHRKAEIAQERGGLMSTIGQTIAGPKFYEMDEWFDHKKVYLDSLESQLKGLVKAIEIVSKQRAELATATGEFAHAIGELAGSELSKQLSHSLVIMSDVEKKAQDLQHVQAQEDVITFMSIADEYARIINSVRLAFSSRIRCYNLWQTADSEVRRVKQAHERARNQGRIPQDRMGHSLSQIADAERKALDAKQEFDRSSRLIKSEMLRFEDERIHDFKQSLEDFLEGMISRQKELISSWESYQELLLKKVNAVQRPPGQPLPLVPS